MPHRGFDGVVSGDVLQRKSVRVLPDLGQKRVSKSMTSGIRIDPNLITQMEGVVGTPLCRNIMRKYGRVNPPASIRDTAEKRKDLQMLESVTSGFDCLDAFTKRQAPPLEISDMKTPATRCLRPRRTRWFGQHDAAKSLARPTRGTGAIVAKPMSCPVRRSTHIT